LIWHVLDIGALLFRLCAMLVYVLFQHQARLLYTQAIHDCAYVAHR